MNARIYPKPEIFNGINVIDVDTHVSEVHDLWTSRAPAHLKDRVPQVKMVNGAPAWVIDGDKLLGVKSAVSAIGKDGSKAIGMGFKDWQIPDVMPASYDTKARVQFMDDHGFKAQIMYPNVLGFAGQAAARLDPELRLVSTQIYNDAMAEMQADSGNRLFPMALIPWWDVKLAVAEVERCHKMGFRGINTNTDPHEHGLPELGDTYWDPLWAVCTGYNMPVNFHIGASDESMTWFGTGSLPSFDLARKVAYGSTMLFLSNARVLVNIMLSRFLERWPDLKMVSVESGVGWIPFILEAIGYQMSEAGIKPKLSPKEIFQRQMYASSWFEREDIIHNARLVGVDNVMFETDFPHPTCLYPNPLGYMAETAAKFTLEERRKIFGGNAARVYNIPV